MKFWSIVVTFAIAVSLVALTLGNQAQANCHMNQRLYDSQIAYTRFLAREFHAKPKQIAAGLADLRAESGPRPSC